MYIYLDESYNLKDRSQKQFISINGFAVLDAASLFKRWKEYRLPFTFKKRRIHATDKFFAKLRLKTLKLMQRADLTLLSVFQILQEIPSKESLNYFFKGRLNFDKLYLDLALVLLQKLKLDEYRTVKIVIDSRKHKGGMLGKKIFENGVLDFLKKNYPETKFDFRTQPSSTDILLELADFISNIFYRAYINGDQQFFDDLSFRLVQIKNPLK